MKREPEENTYFLCRRSATKELVEKAERERDRILGELRAFFIGDIGITIYPIAHVIGNSIAGDLTVNGETCRTYDPVDLCFLELNELMMKRMLEAGMVSMGKEAAIHG